MLRSSAAAHSRLRDFVERRWLFLTLLAAAPIVEYLAARNGAPGPANALVRNPFAAIAAATVFCRYFIRDLRGRTRRWIVYLTPLTWLTALAIEGQAAPPVLLWLDTLFALGVLGVVGFVIAASLSTDRDARADYVGSLMDALLLPLGASMVSYGLWATFRVNPVYHPRIYAFEELLGVKFSLWSAQAYGILTPLSAVATACYNLVAIAVAVVATGQRERGREQEVLNAVLISGACGFALYFVCPVVGPVVSFGPYYPDTLPTVPLHSTLLMAVGGAPRNGMPFSPHYLGATDLVQRERSRRPGKTRAACVRPAHHVGGPQSRGISLADGRGRQRSSDGGDRTRLSFRATTKECAVGPRREPAPCSPRHGSWVSGQDGFCTCRRSPPGLRCSEHCGGPCAGGRRRRCARSSQKSHGLVAPGAIGRSAGRKSSRPCLNRSCGTLSIRCGFNPARRPVGARFPSPAFKEIVRCLRRGR